MMKSYPRFINASISLIFLLTLNACLFKTRDQFQVVGNPGPVRKTFPKIRPNITAFRPSAVLFSGLYIDQEPASKRNTRVKAMLKYVASDKYASFNRGGMYVPFFNIGPLTVDGQIDSYRNAKAILEYTRTRPKDQTHRYKFFTFDVVGIFDLFQNNYCSAFLGYTNCAKYTFPPVVRVAVEEAMLFLHNVEMLFVETVKLNNGSVHVSLETRNYLDAIATGLRNVRGEKNYRIILAAHENLYDSSKVDNTTHTWFNNYILQNEEVILLLHNSESQASDHKVQRIDRKRNRGLPNQVCLQDFYIFEPYALGYRDESISTPQFGISELSIHRNQFFIKSIGFEPDSKKGPDSWRFKVPELNAETLDVSMKSYRASSCDLAKN